uniref:Clarin-3 n=1 Tax=Timema tahoe TaxID=61484 RepID=A0A7R9ICQ8_9NEOP|nr:unnamed protein product [Timema tahoe]
MATTKREFIFMTVLLSCASMVLLVTSLSTTSWVTANMVQTNEITSATLSHINYGLFEGYISRYVAINNPLTFSLTITCVMDLGVCAVSCMQNADDRKAEVRTLYNTGTYDESAMLRGCQGGSSLTPDAKQDNNTSNTSDRRFINAGIWVGSIVFLAVALFMSLVSAGFGVYNAAFNPIETYLAVPGLYIWNGIAACSNLLVLILWGAQFAKVLVENVTYTEVIAGAFKNNTANLGYSYWLVFVAFILHGVNIGLLLFRKYLIDHETPPETPKIDDNDGLIFIY